MRGRLRTAWVQKSGWTWVGSIQAAWRQRAWLRGRQWVRRTARTVADGVGATEWLEMGWEKKPLVMSELGCADGLRMGNGCGELCGRLRTAWVQRSGWLVMSELGWAADGKWVRRIARTAADGVGARERLEMCGGKKPLVTSDEARLAARTAADGVGAREWLEMGGEKKPLVMSELGCADGCGQGMGRGELRGRLRTAWVQGSGWKGEKKALVMSELGCTNGCGRKWVRRIVRTAADGKWV